MTRRFPWLLVTLLILLFPAKPAWAGDLSRFLPENVGDLVRGQMLTGDAATRAVDSLHGKPLPALGSAMARYARPGREGSAAEVWISRVDSEAEARRQTGLMVHKMLDNPGSPFHDPGRVEVAGCSVYRFTGMGKVHLIWCDRDLVFWISAAPGDQDLLLSAFCGRD